MVVSNFRVLQRWLQSSSEGVGEGLVPYRPGGTVLVKPEALERHLCQPLVLRGIPPWTHSKLPWSDTGGRTCIHGVVAKDEAISGTPR